ncbi:MAG: hypothetical protein J7576_11465 [Siphonobacter aquaeclarae]|nr:hypothetical protein [Siphonobacter aquaeclarae]
MQVKPSVVFGLIVWLTLILISGFFATLRALKVGPFEFLSWPAITAPVWFPLAVIAVVIVAVVFFFTISIFINTLRYLYAAVKKQ